jgi:hypothetical protein
LTKQFKFLVVFERQRHLKSKSVTKTFGRDKNIPRMIKKKFNRRGKERFGGARRG